MHRTQVLIDLFRAFNFFFYSHTHRAPTSIAASKKRQRIFESTCVSSRRFSALSFLSCRADFFFPNIRSDKHLRHLNLILILRFFFFFSSSQLTSRRRMHYLPKRLLCYGPLVSLLECEDFTKCLLYYLPVL